jgi:LacI family transcriptional regulator
MKRSKGATIRDVAKKAGVSIGTASNVLNTPSLVAKETRERVERVIEEIGFVRDGAARQLSLGKSIAIGLVVFDVGNPLFATVARAVEDTVREQGYVVILCDGAGSGERETRHLALLEEQRVAGILYAAADDNESPSIARLRKKGVPIVQIGNLPSQADGDLCGVAPDHRQGGWLASRHLLDLGHTSIGMIGGPRELNPNADKREGFLKGLGDAGLRLGEQVDVEATEMTIAAGEQAAQKLLAGKSRPTALFCHNDLLALGALRALAAEHLRVPEDVAVIGHDDIPFAEMSTVPLSSIRPQTYEVAKTAAKLLLEEMAGGPHQHQRIAFQPEVVARASTQA